LEVEKRGQYRLQAGREKHQDGNGREWGVITVSTGINYCGIQGRKRKRKNKLGKGKDIVRNCERLGERREVKRKSSF